jgi:LysR family glycine cleavage system transcriptional activator
MSRNPDVEVRVEATANLVDLKRDQVDVAIRHGLGDYPGLVSGPLMAPVFLPVAAPALLASRPPMTGPTDCLCWPLLQDSDRGDWHLWFKAISLPDDARAERGASFDDDYMLVREAIAGQGLALVSDVYTADEIRSGRLALTLDRPWPSHFAYYAVTLQSREKRQSVQNFIDWLQEEAAAGP